MQGVSDDSGAAGGGWGLGKGRMIAGEAGFGSSVKSKFG